MKRFKPLHTAVFSLCIIGAAVGIFAALPILWGNLNYGAYFGAAIAIISVLLCVFLPRAFNCSKRALRYVYRAALAVYAALAVNV